MQVIDRPARRDHARSGPLAPLVDARPSRRVRCTKTRRYSAVARRASRRGRRVAAVVTVADDLESRAGARDDRKLGSAVNTAVALRPTRADALRALPVPSVGLPAGVVAVSETGIGILARSPGPGVTAEPHVQRGELRLAYRSVNGPVNR